MKKREVVFDAAQSKNDQVTRKTNLEHTNVATGSSGDIADIEIQSEKFEKLIKKSNRVLLRIKSVFPFQLFPDSLIIDESKISIVHRIFFWTAEIQSIPIQHVQDVEVDTSIVFATLKILPAGFSVVSMTENWVTVNYLWRRDAIRARRIIAGLLLASRDGVDLTKVATENFVSKIEGLGEVS